MAEEWLLEAKGICKSFGRQDALRGVDLTVRKGESLAIFGPNGAGKTTLLRILSTLTRPSAGTIRFLGADLRDWGAEARQHIGFVSHRTLLHQDLTAIENLTFYGRMYTIPNLASRIDAALQRVNMASQRSSLVRTLSRGMQQRLAIARLLLYDPLLMLLDEPYTGLDPHAINLLGTLLKEWAGMGRTVILTSHDVERGARDRDRVMVLRAGRVVYEAKGDEWEGQAVYDRYVGEGRP